MIGVSDTAILNPHFDIVSCRFSSSARTDLINCGPTAIT